jgi:ssDNA-specific exonuclease RecJ|tara:strand:- start:174 stop:305 length:132 start_codon:yes stop_codon:yes gene_type:complete
MNTTKELLTAHDIDRMYKEVEAKHPKVMRYIKQREKFRKNYYK